MTKPNRNGRPTGAATSYAERLGNYIRQNGTMRLTDAQRRRANKKANSGRAKP